MELGGSRPGKGLVDAPGTLASLLPRGSIQKEAAREQRIPPAGQGTPTHSPDFPRKSPSLPFPARPSGSTERAFPSPPPRARARGILPLFPSSSARPLSEIVRKLLPFFFFFFVRVIYGLLLRRRGAPALKCSRGSHCPLSRDRISPQSIRNPSLRRRRGAPARGRFHQALTALERFITRRRGRELRSLGDFPSP